MTGLLKRESKVPDKVEAFDWFDRMFDDWTRLLPFRRPTIFGWNWPTEEMIRVDEFRENGTLVVRAELPGLDPDKDVEVTVVDGMLRIKAEHQEEETTEDKAYVRHELRYGPSLGCCPFPKASPKPTSRPAT